MDAQRWRRVRDLFEDAVEMSAEERAEFLRSECGDDEGLRAEVERLLSAHRADPDFLESGPAARFAPPALGIREGSTIAGYRVGPLLGHGGMGEVYRSASPSGEPVALKIVRADLATAAVLRRFDRERDILGRLDHPNIARILDSGTTDDGLPFLVMELVDGVPLDVYCRHRFAVVRPRLELLLEVMKPVAHAHAVGVLHRDLKPGNVLVDEQGTPHLLDFGVAKLLEPGDRHTTTLRALTPRYASPEQRLGHEPTARSDVYSLGVILHELAADEGADESVPGDDEVLPAGLGPVVRRATAERPEDRYASVPELAADLRRWLDGKAPVARRRERMARARRWAPWLAVVLALAVGVPTLLSVVQVGEPVGSSVTSTSRALITWPGRQRLPRLSPEGDRVAFVSDRGPASELWVHDVAASDDAQLLAAEKRIDSVVWGPLGRRLAVTRSANGEQAIEVVSVEDSTVSELARSSRGVVPIRWTPECLFLLQAGTLWCLDVETGERTRRTPDELALSISTADVTPDGRHLVVSATDDAGDRDIWVADLEGGEVRGPLTGDSDAWSPRWVGAAAERFVYMSLRGGHNDIWLWDAGADEPRFLTAGGERELELNVSDDGRQMAVTVARESADLWHIDAAGREQQWTADSREVLWPRFDPVSGRLLIHRSKAALGWVGATDTEIVVFGRDALRDGRIPQPLGDGLLARWSPDGRRILFARWQEGHSAMELWLHELDSDAERRLANRVVGADLDANPIEWSDRRLAWRPDSAAVAYLEEVADGWTLSTVDVTRPAAVPRPILRRVRAKDLFYAPDGSRLALVATAADGGDVVEVVRLADAGVESWLRASTGSLDVVGWRADGRVLVLRTTTGDGAPVSELLEVGPDGATSMAELSTRMPGATVWDPRRERLYYLSQSDGIDNIWVLALGEGDPHALTDNAALGVTYAGLSLDGADGLFVSRQDLSSDLWLYQLPR